MQADAHPQNVPRLIGKTPNPLVFDDSSVRLMPTVSHLKLMNPNLDESSSTSFLGVVRLINIVCLSRKALIHQTDVQGSPQILWLPVTSVPSKHKDLEGNVSG